MQREKHADEEEQVRREEQNCGASQCCDQGALFSMSLNCKCSNTQLSAPCTGCFGSQAQSCLLPWTPLLVLF